jgi:hypothetical protein
MATVATTALLGGNPRLGHFEGSRTQSDRKPERAETPPTNSSHAYGARPCGPIGEPQRSPEVVYSIDWKISSIFEALLGNRFGKPSVRGLLFPLQRQDNRASLSLALLGQGPFHDYGSPFGRLRTPSPQYHHLGRERTQTKLLDHPLSSLLPH